MLEGLFGNATVEKAFWLLLHHKHIIAPDIVRVFGVSLNQAQNALNRLEWTGILTSKASGNLRLFCWDEHCIFKDALVSLLIKAYQRLSTEEQNHIENKSHIRAYRHFAKQARSKNNE